MRSRRLRLEPPPGVRVIEVCSDPKLKGRRLSTIERKRLEADEFERRMAARIYRGVESIWEERG